MKEIQEMVNEIYNNCKIPFQLIVDEVRKYSSHKYEDIQDNIENNFYYNNTKCCIKVSVALSVACDLLKFCIIEKLKGIYLDRKSIISLLLSGQEVNDRIIKSSWPAITKEFNLINIYVNNYNDDLLSYIKQGYLESDIEILFYKGNILMIGRFEEVLEHARSIKNTIESIISSKCYISYCKVDSYFSLKKYYDHTLYKIMLGIKYNIMDSIFDANKLILEGIIDSVSGEMKDDIYERFKKGISKLDNEMIKTMEVFFKCGLNLSEASKELYIHRNTLIYRLDKIQKYTNYDIRDFNEAVLLKIIFFIWKEKSEKS